MELIFDDFRLEYPRLVQMVATRGEPVTVRGLATRELTGVTLTLRDPIAPVLPTGVGRSVSRPFAALEVLDVLAGSSHPKLTDVVAPGWRDVLIDPSDSGVFFAAYGPRMADQLPTVMQMLSNGSATRSAQVVLARVLDTVWPGDRPCTTSLQFLLRHHRLDLHVNMRSQDVWLGVPYDLFLFNQLQNTVAKLLDVEAGSYVHHATSLHVYERDIDDVEKMLGDDDPGRNGLGSPNAPDNPRPIGLNVPPLSSTRSWETIRGIATRLIAGDATPAERRANPWYAEQSKRWLSPQVW
jgi:thymidylate synthase